MFLTNELNIISLFVKLCFNIIYNYRGFYAQKKNSNFDYLQTVVICRYI